jgi:hypothetical protein
MKRVKESFERVVEAIEGSSRYLASARVLTASNTSFKLGGTVSSFVRSDSE